MKLRRDEDKAEALPWSGLGIGHVLLTGQWLFQSLEERPLPSDAVLRASWREHRERVLEEASTSGVEPWGLRYD